jgi:glycosyltransferase involved in cell wall biosynthesis
VVGDGPERKHLEPKAGRGVRFLGNRFDVPELLRVMDIFVLPSINEGISNTILEAMASGLPVLASDTGGNSELVDHGRTGMLFPVRDSETLEAGIIKYLEDGGLRREHGRNARGKVIRMFEVDRMVKAYERVYRRVAING